MANDIKADGRRPSSFPALGNAKRHRRSSCNDWKRAQRTKAKAQIQQSAHAPNYTHNAVEILSLSPPRAQRFSRNKSVCCFMRRTTILSDLKWEGRKEREEGLVPRSLMDGWIDEWPQRRVFRGFSLKRSGLHFLFSIPSLRHPSPPSLKRLPKVSCNFFFFSKNLIGILSKTRKLGFKTAQRTIRRGVVVKEKPKFWLDLSTCHHFGYNGLDVEISPFSQNPRRPTCARFLRSTQLNLSNMAARFIFAICQADRTESFVTWSVLIYRSVSFFFYLPYHFSRTTEKAKPDRIDDPHSKTIGLVWWPTIWNGDHWLLWDESRR